MNTGVSGRLVQHAKAEVPVSTGSNVDAFVREHQRELLAFFQSRVSQPQDAADLAQESWSRMLRYRFETVDSLRGLLYTIARSVLNNHWRWRKLRQIELSTDLNELEVPCDVPGPGRRHQGASDLEILSDAVANLPRKCRTVFLLSRIEGLSNAEVARRCGISVKMVEKHLAKAILSCRAQVGGSDV